MTPPRILVAGIGNIFLGDDGFGVEVVRRLVDWPLASHVRVTDFGIRGLDLAYTLLEGYDLVVLVDASQRGAVPGTLYLLEVDSSAGAGAALETHGMIPTRAVRLALEMGATVERLVIVACEPESFGDPGTGRWGLSGAVSAAVDEAARLIDALVQRHLSLEPLHS